MCAVSFAFMEDNINLTLDFHLMFESVAHRPVKAPAWCFQVTYCPLVQRRRTAGVNPRLLLGESRQLRHSRKQLINLEVLHYVCS